MNSHEKKLGEAQQRDLIQEVCNYFFDAASIDIEIIPHLRRVERIALYGAGAPLDRHDLEALSTLRTITDALEDAANGHSYFDAPEEDAANGHFYFDAPEEDDGVPKSPVNPADQLIDFVFQGISIGCQHLDGTLVICFDDLCEAMKLDLKREVKLIKTQAKFFANSPFKSDIWNDLSSKWLNLIPIDHAMLWAASLNERADVPVHSVSTLQSALVDLLDGRYTLTN